MKDALLVTYGIMLAAHLLLGVILFGTGRALFEYFVVAALVTNGVVTLAK